MESDKKNHERLMKQIEIEKKEIQKKNEESLFNLNKEHIEKLNEIEYLQSQEE